NHFGCGTCRSLKITATAAKRTDNANQIPISSRIQACPPGATVIADETARAMAKRTQRYQERLMTVMAFAAGELLLGHYLLGHRLPLFLNKLNMMRDVAGHFLN